VKTIKEYVNREKLESNTLIELQTVLDRPHNEEEVKLLFKRIQDSMMEFKHKNGKPIGKPI